MTTEQWLHTIIALARQIGREAEALLGTSVITTTDSSIKNSIRTSAVELDKHLENLQGWVRVCGRTKP